MELEYLNWDNVPHHVTVIAYKDGKLNFAVNLRGQEAGSRWIVEGDECDISGDVFDGNQGWGHDWRVLERPTMQVTPPTKSEQDIVVEWLEKWQYVTHHHWKPYGLIPPQTDTVVELFNGLAKHGTKNIVEFINNRYSQLTEQANKLKREKLLADIVKAKEVYEALVGELAELENGL